MRVLLDLDGVVVNFYYGFATFLNEHYGCTLDPNTDPSEYSFNEWGNGVDNIDLDKVSKEWIAQDGFGKLPAYENAEEFVKGIMDKSEVSIVTARIGDWHQNFSQDTKEQIKTNTLEWLKIHNIPNNNLFFTHEKIQFCKENGISLIIEDKMSTALEASKNGINTILINRGYNGSKIDRFKIYRAFNFNEALGQFRKLLAQ